VVLPTLRFPSHPNNPASPAPPPSKSTLRKILIYEKALSQLQLTSEYKTNSDSGCETEAELCKRLAILYHPDSSHYTSYIQQVEEATLWKTRVHVTSKKAETLRSSKFNVADAKGKTFSEHKQDIRLATAEAGAALIRPLITRSPPEFVTVDVGETNVAINARYRTPSTVPDVLLSVCDVAGLKCDFTWTLRTKTDDGQECQNMVGSDLVLTIANVTPRMFYVPHAYFLTGEKVRDGAKRSEKRRNTCPNTWNYSADILLWPPSCACFLPKCFFCTMFSDQ